ASFWEIAGAAMFHEVRPYVSDFSLQAVERATDLDGVAHKKTGHKTFTITPPGIQSPPTPTSG
ncbi:MAG: hypothetical protein Q8K33_09360, partial [Cypionkella sp.]|uniref:hypothetical protein n=1 Tax=Cypionkella sp. TaxID=2811411 RepID=UPI0027314399